MDTQRSLSEICAQLVRWIRGDEGFKPMDRDHAIDETVGELFDGFGPAPPNCAAIGTIVQHAADVFRTAGLDIQHGEIVAAAKRQCEARGWDSDLERIPTLKGSSTLQ